MSEAYRRDGFFPGPEPAGLEEEPSERDAVAVREAEAFLSRYGRMRKRIDLREAEWKRLSARAEGTAGDFLLPAGEGRKDAREEAAVRKMDLEAEIRLDYRHLHNLQEEIWRVLEQLENQDIALLLDDLYLGGMKMTEVAEKTKYCVRQIQRRKRYGLLQVAEILRRQRPMCGYVSPLS